MAIVEGGVVIRRMFELAAGHRLLGHKGKCVYMHGHNYLITVQVAGPKLDELGMVADFGVVKEVIGGWLDKHWDHAFLLNSEDVKAVEAVRMVNPDEKIFIFTGANPTAEVMAAYLVDTVCPNLFKEKGLPLAVTRVTVRETASCEAEARSR